MNEYKKILTSAEVWAVIHARHHGELKVFSSYSAPDGDMYGNPHQGIMYTAYGFECGDWPVIEARTTWDIERDDRGQATLNRNNEKHEYWLCAPVQPDA